MAKNQYWYRNAVIYAIDIDTYRDGDGDGHGDFKGLSEKISYLEELGINCVWLLPFYHSSQKDNGYDVEDYYIINNHYGNYDDFVKFRNEAEKRGIRLVVDLVAHHTSDHHPWFRVAYHNKKSKYYNYYIWTQNPPPEQEENVFLGPPWKFNPVLGEYYHHRYYDFEPDLNVKNPDVREEIKRVIAYWIDSGIAGFRLDAATNMFEFFNDSDDVTPAEVLEDFHTFLTSLREDAFFIAEADVEDSEINQYTANGNRMHMMFNFLLNNSIFLALARGSAKPITERLKTLPKLPENVYWVNFLRNLDELDLEQLTDEEREEVFQVYAPVKRMQIYNRGIRRRLAPMLLGNTRQMKMLYNLLFAIPGVPMIVYGDEIGMGDNIVYEARMAVRTPMQWNAGKNGGFSEAPEENIPLKPIREGAFSYKFVNVEEEKKDADSLLNAIKKFIAVRNDIHNPEWKQFKMLDVSDETIIAFGYSDRLLIFINFTNKTAAFKPDLDLAKYEIILEDGPYHEKDKFTLNGFGYKWFRKK